MKLTAKASVRSEKSVSGKRKGQAPLPCKLERTIITHNTHRAGGTKTKHK